MTLKTGFRAFVFAKWQPKCEKKFLLGFVARTMRNGAHCQVSNNHVFVEVCRSHNRLGLYVFRTFQSQQWTVVVCNNDILLHFLNILNCLEKKFRHTKNTFKADVQIEVCYEHYTHDQVVNVPYRVDSGYTLWLIKILHKANVKWLIDLLNSLWVFC